ncbi:hypothetical protein DTO207G8_688 [Paecilomyces variotii]|nr:hypothetical protein DTO169C6_4904 [Paecilomyces variotii]KAJ9259991.1 hypothetical protein DTO207G8_688 [Paecilomyces variotii]KAJ9347784.1 hypothetical protein DTO027B9_8888 [Paecilomyces variotii]KAJ9392800.1 hypothetical protein DTO063F5_600 [Paecilomyces variotii]KAJ9407503.1 hypothetical protein DTO045G8_4786 [Paecilomyces variotii]
MASNDTRESDLAAEVREGQAPSTVDVSQDKDNQIPQTRETVEGSSSWIQQEASAAIEQPTTSGDNTAPAPSVAPSEAETARLTNVADSEASDSKAAAPEGESMPEQPATPLKDVEDEGPSLVITLLLITGARHPFKIDGKYLRKRAVNVEDYDPFRMSVYTLKELILREWRPEWEPCPSSPSSIRLIYFGKLLEDKAPLSDSRFSRDTPNIVHMTIKPQEVVDEEDTKGAKAQYSREREASERSPRCHCVIL